ncbi:MAG: hypothetical protein HW380_891 [Magnetococcales bacterium]|nr:hypothetical protein [Magnetococcales bacterium]HIJ85031.1 hypothetical protein [Magnetococcales bacterium]
MKSGIFCAVSGHGYGHLSQVAPIIDHLVLMEPELRIMVAGKLDPEVVKNFVRVGHSLDPLGRDVGLVQTDPLVVDLEATRASYIAMQGCWEELVDAEVAKLRAWSADLVVADIPCVTIAAAHKLNIPSVAIASLSWDHVIKAYFSLDDPDIRACWQRMRDNYAKATLALHPEPSIVGDTFPRCEKIPPLVSQARGRKQDLRRALGIGADDARPLIMVNLGGMPSNILPMENIAQENRYHWLFKETQLPIVDHVHCSDKMWQWPFGDVLASVDAIVSKPGYGIAIHSAAMGVPLLYVRRQQFPDEDPICQWLSKHSAALEIGAETFASGRWHAEIQRLLHTSFPLRPECNGAEKAAEKILGLLRARPIA